MEVLLALILSTFHPQTVVAGFPMDTGMGKCQMDQHWHNSDGLCHRDSDDSPLHKLRS